MPKAFSTYCLELLTDYEIRNYFQWFHRGPLWAQGGKGVFNV
jgi:hypothetical protein